MFLPIQPISRTRLNLTINISITKENLSTTSLPTELSLKLFENNSNNFGYINQTNGMDRKIHPNISALSV